MYIWQVAFRQRPIRASLTLRETRSIHDIMNIPKIEFISLVILRVCLLVILN